MSEDKTVHSEALSDGNKLVVTYIPVNEPEAYFFSIHFYDSEDGEYCGRAGNGEWYDSLSACIAAGYIEWLTEHRIEDE